MKQILNIKCFNDDSRDACAYRGGCGCITNSTAIILARLKHAVHTYLGRLSHLDVRGVCVIRIIQIQHSMDMHEEAISKAPPRYPTLHRKNSDAGLRVHPVCNPSFTYGSRFPALPVLVSARSARSQRSLPAARVLNCHRSHFEQPYKWIAAQVRTYVKYLSVVCVATYTYTCTCIRVVQRNPPQCCLRCQPASRNLDLSPQLNLRPTLPTTQH